MKQQTFGTAYELQWTDVGEMSVGLQKTSYSKSVDTPTAVLPESRSNPWLKYATATVNATERLAFYASYTEGLEESPVAPNNALNRNVAAPALQTEQYDAGLRWAAFANMKLIAGIFNVEKPYFDLDAAGFFTELGTVEHRGVEVSLAGRSARRPDRDRRHALAGCDGVGCDSRCRAHRRKTGGLGAAVFAGDRRISLRGSRCAPSMRPSST